MKVINSITGIVIGSLIGAGLAFAAESAPEPKEVLAPVEKVFLPTGFDNNDNTEIILHGEFPNSCYKVGHSSYSVDKENKVINVSLTAYEYRSNFCIQVLTPYVESIKVGVLPAGQYKVNVAGSDIKESIRIGQSIVSSPDSYLYAQVTNASLINIRGLDGASMQKVEIEGEYPYTFVGCAVMERVEVFHVRDDILEVLPILKLLEGGDECIRHSNDFLIQADVSSEMFGEGLLHVRSASGNSFNRVVDGL